MAGGPSPTHLVACVALLRGLVAASNPALLEQANDAADAAAQQRAAGQGGFGAAGVPLRLARLLDAVVVCFAALAERPQLLHSQPLLRPAPAPLSTPAPPQAAAAGAPGAPVLVRLCGDVLSTAAGRGLLLQTGAQQSGAIQAAAQGPLVQLLQAMLRAAAATAAVGVPGMAAAAAQDSPPAAAAAHAWLLEAASVCDAAVEACVAEPAAVAASSVQPAAEALSSLLRHVSGRLRGCTAAGPAADRMAAPAWAPSVVRLAAQLAPHAPGPAAAVTSLADTLAALLAARSPSSTAATDSGARDPGLELDPVEQLAATLVATFTQADANLPTAAATHGHTAAPVASVLRPPLLACAARSLRRAYDGAGGLVPSGALAAGSASGGALLSIRYVGGAVVARKLRAVQAAGALAALSPAAMHAVVASGERSQRQGGSACCANASWNRLPSAPLHAAPWCPQACPVSWCATCAPCCAPATTSRPTRSRCRLLTRWRRWRRRWRAGWLGQACCS